MTQEQPIRKDWLLRFLAVAAYFVAIYFSFISRELDFAMLSVCWGLASLVYWGIVSEFEKRDRRWTVKE